VYYCIWCSALVVLAVVGWGWVVSCVHRVKVTVPLGYTDLNLTLATIHT
jgi:hypothetical protein